MSNFFSIAQVSYYVIYEGIIFICKELPMILQICQIIYYFFASLKNVHDLKGKGGQKNKNNRNNVKIESDIHFSLNLGIMILTYNRQIMDKNGLPLE